MTEKKHILISRVRQLERYCPQKGKLLEIGCGIGLLLEAAQELGWDIHGIEPSEDAVVSIANAVKDKITNDILTRGLFEENEFDAVVFWSVLEHISNPLEVLTVASSILKKGGLLVIQTPNISSLNARCFKGRWAQANEVDHLCLWPKITLITQLKKIRFFSKTNTKFRGAVSFWVEKVQTKRLTICK